MNYREEYKRWCTDPVFDEETRRELSALADEKEIEDRFYKTLTFGTGGLRGVIGAGTNRMNIYTVGKATQGLADFINSETVDGSVAIAYDSRRMSSEFALRAACILAANGIRAYLFESLRPTPELSFAVRYLHATAGIVITASHNPPQYNGYKVYWSDGGQIVPPYDKKIIDRVNAVSEYGAVRTMSEAEARRQGMIEVIGKEVDDAYMDALKRVVLRPEVIRKMAKDIKIVYTPLNGTGYMPVTRVLKELGFENVRVVPQQAQPDGNFPTLRYPNPEDPAAFALALELAEQTDADIVLATDPDADRLGVYAKDGATGRYMPFTGNMSGLLIAEYELSQREALGLLPADRADGALVTTIVSSNMAYPLARAYGLTVIEVLTGFKYIGEQIRLFEEAAAANGGAPDHTKGAYEYEFGFEESYGCLVGTHARDKDAVVAVMALCEAAAYYKSQGMTLCDQMRVIYEKYGFYREALESVTIPGAEGAAKIEAIISDLRKNAPREIGGQKVLALRDYRAGTRTSLQDGRVTELALPQSNVLYFELEEDGWCCVRPSGTEPKIKFYFGVRGADMRAADEKLLRLKEGLLALAGNV
mgnify:FL=1